MGTAPTTAAGFTQMFANKNDLVWSGGDQMTSFKHNGFTYWLTGDTILSDGVDPDGSYPDGTVMVSNQILLQSGDQFVSAITGTGNAAPDPATHTDANQKRYWPQGMFYANGHLYVLLQHVEADGVGGFKLRGAELGKYSQGSDGKLTLKAVIATPSTGVDQGPGPLHIQWCGDALVSSGYVYFYGFTHALNNAFVAHFSYVARVPVAQVENPNAWRFYAKTTGTWKTQLRELDQDLGNQWDAILPSQVSSVRWINNKHVMVHKPWNGWGADVIATTSPSPYGPWTEGVSIIQSPAGVDEHGHGYVTYSPQLHPEQVLASGKTLVSVAYNNSGGSLADLMACADLYKPRFFEVQF